MRFYAKLGGVTLKQLKDDEFTIEVGINKIGKFEYVIANDADNRTVIRDNATQDFEIYRKSDDKLIFKGKIDEVIYESREKIRITGLAHYIDLAWVIHNVSGNYRVEYNNVPAVDILTSVLEGTAYTILECPTDLVSMRGEFESKLRWISALAKALTWVDADGNSREYEFEITLNNEVRIVSQLGSYKGDITNYLISFEKTEEFGGIYNYLIGLGYGEGINQLMKVVSDATSIANYGQRESVLIDKRIKHDTTLENKLRKALAKHKDPVKKFRAKVSTDFFIDNLSLGDTVDITLSEWDTSETLRIVGARIGPLETELTISNEATTVTDYISDLKDQLDVANAYMQGTTCVSNFGGGWQAVDATYPAKWVFYLPDSSVGFVRVNECFINVRGRAYRIWSKGAASGGAASTTSATWSPSSVLELEGKYILQPDVSENFWLVFEIPSNWDTSSVNAWLFTFEVFNNGSTTYSTTLEVWKVTLDANKNLVSADTQLFTLSITVPNNSTYVFNTQFAALGPNISPGDALMIYVPDPLPTPQTGVGPGGLSYFKTKITGLSYHNHTVDIPAHTHEPEPGIFETANYPSNVSVKIYNSAYPSGVTVISGIAGGSDFDQEKIDISQYVTPGKNEIEVTSDTLGMIQVDGFYRIFIQTK